MHDQRQHDSPLGTLRAGLALPELMRLPSTRTLVKFAGAAGDFYEIHYDHKAARAAGLAGVIVHGSLKGAYLAQLVTRWLGDRGRLTRIDVRYRNIDYPGLPLRCRGVVSSVREDGADLDLWSENTAGMKTTTASATVEWARSR